MTTTANPNGTAIRITPIAPIAPIAKSPIRVVVSKSRKGYVWQQLAKNGMVGAVSPKTYDTKGSAKRAAARQATLLLNAVVVVEGE